MTSLLNRPMVSAKALPNASLTNRERGMEFAGHKHFRTGIGVDVHFADARSP